MSLRRTASRCWRGGSLRGATCRPGRPCRGCESPPVEASPWRSARSIRKGTAATTTRDRCPGGSTSGDTGFTIRRRARARSHGWPHEAMPETARLRGDARAAALRETWARAEATAPVRCGPLRRARPAWRHAGIGTGHGGARGSRVRRLAAHTRGEPSPEVAAPGPIDPRAQAREVEDQRLRDAGDVVRAGDVASRPPARAGADVSAQERDRRREPVTRDPTDDAGPEPVGAERIRRSSGRNGRTPPGAPGSRARPGAHQEGARTDSFRSGVAQAARTTDDERGARGSPCVGRDDEDLTPSGMRPAHVHGSYSGRETKGMRGRLQGEHLCGQVAIPETTEAGASAQGQGGSA